MISKKDYFEDNANQLIELGKIKNILSSRIYDQEIAVESVKDMISRAVFEQRKDTVKAIMFFVGPSGCGKTYLSEETGNILNNFGYKTKLFDMSLYENDLASYLEIEENQKSLLIFDDIEKCSLLQQQDIVRLLDNTIVKSNECIVIFTSNLGHTIYERNDYVSMIKNKDETQSLMLDAISNEKQADGSLCINRSLLTKLSSSKVVLFKKVGLKAYFNMSEIEIKRYFDVIEDKFGVKLECSDEAILVSYLQYLPFTNPKVIKNKIGDDLFDILRDYIQNNNINISNFKAISIEIDDDIKKLLNQNLILDINKLQFNDERFQELLDKKLTLDLDFKFEQTETTLKLIFINPNIHKIKNIQDLSGDIKIELEIPSGKLKGEPQEKIYGHDYAKDMLVHISNKIQRFQLLQRQNDKESTTVLKNIPKGILLYGPPGTGKTKLARAFAAQVECPIIVSSGKDMLSNVERIKDIFKKAREYAPCVLFIDEIDTIGNREQNQLNNININALLEELDGFNNDVYKPVFIIAATNKIDYIDPAIIRAGRIEKHIKIDSLTKEARIEFINDTFKDNDSFSSMIEVSKFLNYTVGMSGAQLEMVFKNARYKLDILREDNQNDKTLKIEFDNLVDVVNEVRYGEINKSRIDSNYENTLTAYHEAGRTVVSLALTPELLIEQISITPRVDCNSNVTYNHEDIYRWDKEFFVGKIATAYAGRVAEELYFEKNKRSSSLGLSRESIVDISLATKLIKEAVLNLGMDTELGFLNYDNLDVSELTKQKIDKVILAWQNNLNILAKRILQENWDSVEIIVKELVGDDTTIGRETIDSQWLDENIYIDFNAEVI